MSAPIERLRELCEGDPVGEKIVLVPTYGVGQRLTDTVARAGTPWIGLRAVTLDGIALETAADHLVREGRALLSRAQALSLVESACEEVLSDEDYFGALRRSSGFFRSIRRSIDDLRLSGVRASDFPTAAIPNRRKANEIQRILARYEKLLDSHRLIDRAALYGLAVKVIGGTPRVDRVFSAGLHDLRPVQTRLLEAFAGEHLLLQDDAETVRLNAEEHRIVSARGSENEIRAIIRKAIHESIPLDSIEIVHTNRDLYVPLIVELSAELDIDVTFDEGVPVPYTRPGQAILGYLEWLRLGWDAPVLRKLISSGVIETKGIGPVLAARLFRNATVGWGRSRHLERMDALVSEHERKVARSEGDERAERGLKNARHVKDLVRGLIRCTPTRSENIDVGELAGHAIDFLKRFARVASPRDAASREALLRVLEEIRTLPEARDTLEGAAVRLDELVREISVVSESPRPGALHVASIQTGGWGGRSHLFLVGLDERFPGGSLQDPVLLDEERTIINRRRNDAGLQLSGARPELQTRDLVRLLDRVDGSSTTFLFSSEDLLDGRELLPSPFLLDLWRSIHGKPEATYDQMIETLEAEKESFASGRPASEAEEWIRRLQSLSAARGLSPKERKAARSAMGTRWPWLSRGMEAIDARQQREISEWSGKIAVAPEAIDPRLTGKPLSASRIEKLAQSPFRYFLEDILRIEPLEELERRPEEWLEAREFGGLFHDVLYRFMSGVVGRNETPGAPGHAEELEAIALGELDSIAKTIPPPSTAAFEIRRKELLEACGLFLSEETKWCSSASPRWFEVPFGMGQSDDAEFGSREPVKIDLGDAGAIVVRGRIDRIDECGSKRFSVWDYKSGSSYKYSDQDYLARGTQVQHAVYALAARELLARNGIEGEVVEAGYYFPTRKGRGLRIKREPPFSGDWKARLETVLGGLLDTIANGSFVHAIDEDDCTFCEFVPICGGDVRSVTKRAEEMAKSSDDDGVAAFLRAREIK